MKLLSVQIGQPKTVEDGGERPWRTGFFKDTIRGAIFAGSVGLAGDGQADLENHGGPDKAINVYPKEHWPDWEKELRISLPHGAFGENLTTTGLVEQEVCVGDIFQLGDALLQVSQPRQPCWKLARRWKVKDLAAQVEKTGRTGWYFRVLREGEIEAPSEFVHLERPHPEWTIAAANEVMYRQKNDQSATRSLANCSALSESWRSGLMRRAAALD